MLKPFKRKKKFHKSRKGRSRRQEAEAPDKIQLLNLKKEGGRRLLQMKRLKETIANYSSWVEKNNKTAMKETLGNKEEINMSCTSKDIMKLISLALIRYHGYVGKCPHS